MYAGSASWKAKGAAAVRRVSRKARNRRMLLRRACNAPMHPPPRAGASGAERIGKQFAVLKDTRWHWNNWRDVVLRADGSFLAPAENCERDGNPKCKWYTSGQQIFIKYAPPPRTQRRHRRRPA